MAGRLRLCVGHHGVRDLAAHTPARTIKVVVMVMNLPYGRDRAAPTVTEVLSWEPSNMQLLSGAGRIDEGNTVTKGTLIEEEVMNAWLGAAGGRREGDWRMGQ